MATIDESFKKAMGPISGSSAASRAYQDVINVSANPLGLSHQKEASDKLSAQKKSEDALRAQQEQDRLLQEEEEARKLEEQRQADLALQSQQRAPRPAQPAQPAVTQAAPATSYLDSVKAKASQSGVSNYDLNSAMQVYNYMQNDAYQRSNTQGALIPQQRIQWAPQAESAFSKVFGFSPYDTSRYVDLKV
jgi:hypothetical protein